MKMHDLPDSHGHFGPYGGVFVAETLIQALDELRLAYEKYRSDPEFIAEFRYDLKHYVGRPSPVYHCKRWSGLLGDRAVVLTREAAIQRGWFGPVSASVLPRLGDVVVACRDDWGIFSSVDFAYELTLVGLHGSLTSAEMRIPLMVD
jgi:hypothetical protein